MPEDGMSAAVRRFLQQHISSLEQLEVLLLLRGHPARTWTAEEVSRELGSSLMSMRERLGDLTSRRFLTAQGTEAGPAYRYAPESEETAALIDGLARAYKERRLTVINQIYGGPDNDLRSFSDAFIIKKK